MNIRRLGILVMALASFFLTTVTLLELPSDPKLLCWLGAVGFFLYGVRLMWKQMEINDYEKVLEQNVNSEDIDDVQFDFYLKQKEWARKRFTWVTRVTLGLALGMAVF